MNVSSIGGKVAVPHLAPYAASKFALVGLSDTFRAELARDGILVTTVTPGDDRLLPRPVSDPENQTRTGLESRAIMPPFWITRLGDQAAVRNKELEPEMNL